jgi:uncharacterized protein DUF3108
VTAKHNSDVMQTNRSQHHKAAPQIVGERDFERRIPSKFRDIGFYPALLAGMIMIFLSADDRSFASSLFVKLIRIPNAINVAMAALCIPHRCLMAIILLFATPMPAMSETIDAVYGATLAGISIGKARLTGGVGAGAYTIRLKGEASLMGFSSRFEASSNGASRGTRILPTSYLLKTEGSAARTIEVNFAGDRAASVSIEPQPSAADQEGRLPVELAHLKEVLDPMSAMMTEILRASQSDNPCDGVAHVFTGNMRFDMTLMSGDPVIGEIVCRAIYRPIAGHKLSSSSKPTAIVIAYPRAGKAGEPKLPIRLEIPLPVGTVMIRRIT